MASPLVIGFEEECFVKLVGFVVKDRSEQVVGPIVQDTEVSG